ncbi:MAG: glycosyltransferase [Verrucomicrobiota bacterium]
MSLLFWAAFMLVAYTFLGYPLLIGLLARGRKRAGAMAERSNAPVSVVLVAHNEAHRLEGRVRNLLDARGVSGSLQVVVVSDGSSDGTVELAKSLSDERVLLVECRERRGKAACLNDGVAAARGEIIVFADARQQFEPTSIPNLIRHFSDPRVGAVSGNCSTNTAATSVGGGVDAYWRLEKFVRGSESLVDSSVGCTGAIYAIRKSLFRPLPADTILDDVVTPMNIVTQGYRVVFDPEAVCFDPQPLEPASEKIRKRRTLAGNFQMLFRHPAWLLPWRNRVWWQLISHKYLRLLGPVLMLLTFVTNALLLDLAFYRLLFSGQCGFYLLALTGMVFPGKSKLLALPAGFVFLNWMTVRGFWYFLTRANRPGWETVKTPA